MVAPMTKREVYEETVKYCDRILEILKDWEGSNDHPPGRIIYQCEWLKQEIERNRLPVPFYNMIHNIRHTYVDGDMPDEAYEKGIQKYLGFIIDLSRGCRLVTPEHYQEVVEDIDQLLMKLRDGALMDHAGAKELVEDLEEIRSALHEGKDVVPMEKKIYRFFGEPDLFLWSGSVFEDHADVEKLIRRIAYAVFGGHFREGCYRDPQKEATRMF